MRTLFCSADQISSRLFVEIEKQIWNSYGGAKKPKRANITLRKRKVEVLKLSAFKIYYKATGDQNILVLAAR